jgi:para-nitrobenzyl esterase
VFGAGQFQLYNGSRLAANGNVVVVNITYRIGVFGGFELSDLGDGFDDNLALRDQLAALRWIRDNIAAFGGDPARVTLFGVSSGGASIALLLTSPLAAGLFDQVILQSAGSFRPLATLEAAAEAGAQLGTIDALRALPADEALALEPRLIPAVRGLTTPRILRPIIDGWVVPRDERAAYAAGKFTAVPAIVGSNADEGSRLIASWPVDDLAGWRTTIDANFPDAVDQAATLWPAHDDSAARPAVAAMFGDSQFQLGTRELARALRGAGKPVYRYLFTKQRAGTTDGPHHGGEVAYVFGHLDQPPAGAATTPPDTRDTELSRAITRAWAQFAQTGDPGDIDGVPWPTADQGLVELGDQTSVRAHWRDAQLDFLNAYADR